MTGYITYYLNNSGDAYFAVVDPGFPGGWGGNSPGGPPTYDFAKISPKLHEIERIWTGGAHPKFYYVNPPLLWWDNFKTCWKRNKYGASFWGLELSLCTESDKLVSHPLQICPFPCNPAFFICLFWTQIIPSIPAASESLATHFLDSNSSLFYL